MKNLFEKINSTIKVLAQLVTISMRFNSFAFVVVLLLMSGMVKGQSTANYAFTTNTTGSLALDANGNAIDMTLGTTQLLGTAQDDVASTVTNIGFTFTSMGVNFTQFSVNSNGAMALGSIAVATSGTINSGTSTSIFIAPFGGDQTTNATNSKIHYKLSGASPNRCLVIEWSNMLMNYSSTSTNGDGTYQVRLYETTGVIEFVYGSMNVVTAFGTGPIIGFSSGIASSTIASITSSTNAVVTNGTSFSRNNYTTGNIANLHSTTDGSRRVYKFTPPTPAAGPSNLTFASVAATTTTLNWTAASPTTNIVRYVVFNSTNGGTSYNFVANVALGTNTYAATGLTPGTSYTWKVVALSEGVEATSVITGTQTTTAATTYYYVGAATGSDFSTAASWNTNSDGTGTNRTVAATTDILIVDGIGTTNTAGGITIAMAASQSLGALRITNSTGVTLQSSATTQRILTLTGSVDDEFSIGAGSSVLLTNITNSVSIVFATGTGMTGTIAGTLTVAGASTTSTSASANSFLTTGGTGTIVTVSSTGVIKNTATSNISTNGNVTGSLTSLIFSNGSQYNVSGATTGAFYIPLATWASNSTVTLSGSATSPSTASNSVQSFGNFVVDLPSLNGTLSFWTSSTTAIIQGNLVITAAGTGIFRALTTGTLTVNGNVNVLQGRFQSANSTGTFIVLGNTNNSTNGILEIYGGTYSQRGATLTNDGSLTGPSGTLQYLNLTGSAAQTLAGSGTVLTNLGTLSLQNTAGLNITHTNPVIVARVNLFQGTITGSNKITFGTGSVNCLTQIGATSLTTPGGSFDAIPTFNLGTGLYSVIYAQESVSRTTGFEIPSTRTLNSLTLSNSNGLTIAGGALSSEALTFSAGCGNITTSSSNVLTISGTTTGAITRTSTTAYVNGPLALTLPASLLTGSTYLFPIGKGTLNSLELINPTTNAGGTVTIQAEVFDANSGGTAGLNMGSLNTDRYWATSITSGSGNFTNTFIKLNDASVISTSAISSSATQTGSYDIVGGTLPTIVAGTSITSATTASTSIPGFYNIGTKSVPMAYTSSTTTQAVTTPIFTNTTNQQIIGVQVFITGNASPLSMTSMTFNTTGTTSTADITNAKVFYTGTSSTFATTTQFGSTNATPNGSYNITGSQTLAEGTNYFWLTYDIPNSATVNNVVDAECTSLTVGIVQTPDFTTQVGTRIIKAQLNGTYSIGASQTSPNYSSLTSAISDLNSYGVSGAVTFQLMSDYSSSSETYPLTINAITGGSATNTLTIKPASGVTASISGFSASNAIIKLNGADYVTIDGSNNGTSSRNLTINNTGGTSAGIWVGSIGGAGNGANNNTIKNLIIFGNSGTVSGNYGIISSANSAFATAASDNDNLTITNNNIYKVYTGISALTSSSTGLDANGLSVTNNSIGNSTTANYVTYRGIELSYATSPTINQNNIFNIITIEGINNTGINIDAGVVNGTISGNTITGLRSTNSGGYGSYGINFSSSVGTSGVVVANNLISDILTINYSASSSIYNAFGIRITGGNSLKIYYNTINLFGTTSSSLGASAGLSANLCVTSPVTGLEVKNNIFTNTTSFSVAGSFVANVLLYSSLTFNCNYNDFYGTGNTNNTYYTGYNGASGWITTLANWRTSTTQDANSISIAPTFTSATDLHLTSANADLKAGTYISSVLTDYDGDTRNVLTPTMGADEIYIANLWTGTSSTAFATAGNWDDNVVPSSGANITIPTGVTNKPALASDKTIGTLSLGSGTTLSIGSNTLTINGAVSGTGTLTGSSTSNLTIAGAATTLNFTSGSRSLNNLSLGASGAATLGTALDIYGTIGFTAGGSLNMNAKAVALKSTASATASISDLTGSTLSGATNLTVERFIPANRKYRFLAAPVLFATAAQWRDNGGTTPGIGTHITGGSVGSNFDQSTLNAPSAFWYDEANAGSITDVGSGASSDPGWTAFTNGNTQDLINGKGFRIFVRGDRTLSLTGSIPTANNTTLSVTGTYPGASVSIATTKTNSNTNSGFNLVGNPYPASIDWNTVTKGANISATYSTFNPTSNSYVMWNGSTGDATRYIASGQAFFVQQTGATGGITIAEANKVSNAAGNFFRNKLADHLKVSMKYDSANYDAAYIHFRSDAQNDFDTYDGLKFQNAGVNIASVGTDGKRYNINSLASLNQTTEIPLSVLGSALSNFELKFEDVESFKNHELYLIDHYLNKMLLLSDGFTYPIALSSDSASVKDGRFKIVFVQKATGIQNNNKNTNAFILYPNPAANTIHLLLDAKNTYNENVSFEIFNQLGARLQQGNLDFTTAKDQTIAIDNLAQGSYFIKLQSKSIHQTIKFIK